MESITTNKSVNKVELSVHPRCIAIVSVSYASLGRFVHISQSQYSKSLVYSFTPLKFARKYIISYSNVGGIL